MASTNGSLIKKYEEGAKKRSAGRNTPFINKAGEDFTDANAGTAKLFRGDVKGGVKQIMKSGISSVTGGPLWGLNQAPDPTYLGGSAEALDARRQQYSQGIGQGQAITQGGLNTSAGGAGMISDAYGQAGLDRGAAQGMAFEGAGIGQAGIGSQNAAIQGMIKTAGQRGPSAAEAQMRMGLDQTQQAMMAQAASARGGNQAAAMRTAQAGGAQMAGQVNQQAAVLRAQEEAARRAQLVAAQQSAAGMYGNQAGLGYGMYGQGLSLAQSSTGQQGQMGANVGSIGLGQAGVGNQMQGNYLGAQTASDKAQLDADEKLASASGAAKGGVMGLVKNLFSFGG